jgi:serine protease AprX
MTTICSFAVSQGRLFLRAALAVAVFAGSVAMPDVAAAQGQAGTRTTRARLSADLKEQIATGNTIDQELIITGSREQVQRIVRRHGLDVILWLEGAGMIIAPASALAALADDIEADAISSNQLLTAQMAVTNETIGADLVQAGTWGEGATAYTGSGIGIALIDSGVADLPQLKGRIAARFDYVKPGGLGLDEFGHGTHVAGIIAAAGANKLDTTRGVAPGAHIVSFKVLDAQGKGTSASVILAIDAAIANKDKFNIKVINLSLGGAVLQPAADDPLCQAVERAFKAGITVVASAGNFGKTNDGTPIYGGVTTPGISPYAVTVGAVNTFGTPWREDDEVASYSSRGPTRFDNLIKPDLVAPGNKIDSLVAAGSTLVKTYPELVTGTGANARLRLSGTSMAAGVVSGAASLILEAHPGASPFTVRTALQLGAAEEEGGLIQAGAGSLDVAGSLSLGADSKGFAFANKALWQEALLAGDIVLTQTVVWGSSSWGTDETVVWGSSWGFDDTVVWGSSETVVWGSSETVVWGSSETVVWGSSETVVWGSAWGTDETVVWGSSSDETVVWGSNWGTDETGVWGVTR